MQNAFWPFLFLLATISAASGCGEFSGSAAQPQITSPAGRGADSEDVSVRETLGRIKYERDKLSRSIQRLEKDRVAVVRRLRSAGISSSSDLSRHPDSRVDAQELAQIVSQIQRLEKTASEYDSAIARLESVVRQRERQLQLERSAPSEAELERLSTAFREAEDALAPTGTDQLMEDLQIEETLDAELGQRQDALINLEN